MVMARIFHYQLVDNISQKLNNDIKDEIRRIQNTDNLQLHDVAFDEFLRQITELNMSK